MVLSVIEYNHGKPNNKSSVEGGNKYGRKQNTES